METTVQLDWGTLEHIKKEISHAMSSLCSQYDKQPIRAELYGLLKGHIQLYIRDVVSYRDTGDKTFTLTFTSGATIHFTTH